MRTDARIFRATSPLGLGRCWLGGGGCWLCGQTQTRPVQSPPLSPGRGHCPDPAQPPLPQPDTECCPEHWPGWWKEKTTETLQVCNLLGDWLRPRTLFGWAAGQVPAPALSFPGGQDTGGHTQLCTAPQSLPPCPQGKIVLKS